MVMPKDSNQLAFTVKLELSYEHALEKVIEGLKNEGFGVLTQIDIKDTLKQRLDTDFRKYTILGACNPILAHRALTADLETGLLLPCNVIVYEENGGSVVAIIDPISMLGVIQKPELEAVAREARVRLARVADFLSD